ncbi:MAG: NnrS family protein [Rhodobiaceae bacterium]|nr:NnrS family protein [Rhodobiaceae bacterium]
MSARVPLVLTGGFRLFFTAAAITAIGAMTAWMGWIGILATDIVISEPSFAVAPQYWHSHEMIFGYAVAVIAGFFLTAVPNWTGEKEARWVFVSIVGGIWLAGRIAVWFSAWIDPVIVAALDLAFLPLLSWRLASNLIKRPKPQNVALLGLLGLIFAGNVMIHMEWAGLTDDTARRGLWLALFAICALIAVIGGRITPAFTRNVMLRNGIENGLPVSRAVFERSGIISALILGPAYACGAPEWLLGSIALVAAVTNGARIAGWRSRATFSSPILWALHLGFAMLVFGYALLAASWLTGWPHPVAAMHGLAIGAIGGMPMAMMTRAPLGHTGRALTVRPAIAVAYLLIPLAMVIRVFGTGVFPQFYNWVILLSGAIWVVTYAIYIFIYWPVLTGPDERAANHS